MTVDETNLLSLYFCKLHSLNTKLHHLDIKKSVFVIDDIIEHNKNRDDLIAEIDEIMVKIGKIYYGIRK